MRSSDDRTYGDNDERVLVLLPESRDAGSIPKVLEKIGVASTLCSVPEEIGSEIDKGAGAVLLEIEALSLRAKANLVQALDRQPPWSELPIILLLHPGAETQASRDAMLLWGDVTLVELPVRVNTLVSVIRSALRSRRRQYLVRDQLRALNESYRTLFDSIDEGFCIIEMIFDADSKPIDYRFLETNPSFEKHTGLINVQGKSVRELAPGLEERWFQIYGRVALTGEPIRFDNRAEQLHRWFDVYAFRIGPPESRQVAVLFTDITARKRAESELRQAKDELEIRVQERTKELSQTLQKLRVETEERMRSVEELHQKDQLLIQQGRLAAIGEAIGFIAHQWRQPLNTLGLIIQELSYQFKRGMLQQETVDASTVTALQVIDHMSQTITDFRDFFKPDKQKIPFLITDVLGKTIKLVESSFRESQVAVEVQAEENVVIEGYPNEFSQVLLNILMNCRDIFRERNIEQPRIEIRIYIEDGKAVTTITDNAGGVPEEAIGKIFEPYFTTKEPEKGTGIGLYLAKTIVERNMGGRLSVRNTEVGAEFSIEVTPVTAPGSE